MLVRSWDHVGGWIFPLFAPENRHDDGDGDDDGGGDGDGVGVGNCDGDDEDDDQGVPLKLFSYQMIQISKKANFTLSLNYDQSLCLRLDTVQSLSPHACIVYT